MRCFVIAVCLSVSGTQMACSSNQDNTTDASTADSTVDVIMPDANTSDASQLDADADANGQSGDGSDDGGDGSSINVVRTHRLAIGASHVCAITPTNAVKCWGDDSSGQLGDNVKNGGSINAKPVATQGLTNIASIAAGYLSSYAITSTGALYSWGSNFNGELGDGTKVDKHAPVAITSIATTGMHVGSNSETTCTLLTTNGIDCWGNGESGTIGNGLFDNHLLPTASMITNAIDLDTGKGSFSCAVLPAGTVQCWGNNDDANGSTLGDGLTTQSATPITVSGISTAVSVGVGAFHACAVLASGGVSCWGSNFSGELGDGTTNEAPTPVTASITDVVAVAPGFDYTCVLTASGAVKCVGLGGHGELGQGSFADSSSWVTPIASGAIDIATGRGFNTTCAYMADNSIACWGYNDNGQVGDGTTTARNTPTKVVGF